MTDKPLTTIDEKEQNHFAKTASTWWDLEGPFAVLHRINPVRLSFIKEQICNHFKITDTLKTPFEKFKILDIGSGGGLVAEPMARLGGKITALESEPQTVAIAREHSRRENLNITYQVGGIEDVEENTFDCVLALEVVEHVSDVALFCEKAVKALKPGGLLILSTLNRNLKSFFLGILAAEYVLKWAPKGTHEYKKFLKPSEIANLLRKLNLEPLDAKGISFSPLKRSWYLSQDLGINYIMSFAKP